MKLEEIRLLAKGFMRKYRRWVERAEIAGSIRREKPDCKDIEVVCVPIYSISTNMFGQELSRSNMVICNLRSDVFDGEFRFVKGNNDCPKYTQLEADYNEQKIKIDLFFATPENWGWIFFLRTGSAEWNKRVIQRLKERGYKSRGGQIKDGYDKVIPTPEEKTVFALLGWKWVEPRNRR